MHLLQQYYDMKLLERSALKLIKWDASRPLVVKVVPHNTERREKESETEGEERERDRYREKEVDRDRKRDKK